MENKKALTQAAFGKLIGVSQQMVSKYIQTAMIPESAIIREGYFTRILPKEAIEALVVNLDPGQGKKLFKVSSQEISTTNNDLPELPTDAELSNMIDQMWNEAVEAGILPKTDEQD